MPFWSRKKLMCTYCNGKEATRKVRVEGTKWVPICEECFLEKFKTSYAAIDYEFI